MSAKVEELLMDCIVRCVELPCSIGGYVTPNDDDTFNIYINSNLSEDKQKSALLHELRHISRGHYWQAGDIIAQEADADKEANDEATHTR